MSQRVIRRYSKIQVPIHFTWTTFERRPLITPEVERIVHRSIYANAARLDCTALAVNGMPDHIHLAVLFSPNVTIARFVGEIKSLVTHRVREVYGEDRFFIWESGYAAHAFPYSQRDRVIAYIRGQKEHHANNTIYALWEETEVWQDGVLMRAGDVEGG